MTTMHPIELVCPVCNTELEGRIIRSTNTFGGQTTDFHTMAVGFDVLDFVITTCHKCGFTDYSSDFGKKYTITDDLRNFIENELTPHTGARLQTSLKYKFAALLSEFTDADVMITANNYLRAAWFATDKTDEISYRLAAIEFFKKGLESGQLPESEAITITYLIGELYRRIDEKELATTWFNRAIREGERRGDEESLRIVEIATQQRDDPKDMFGQ